MDRPPAETALPASPDLPAARCPCARQARSCCRQPLPPSANARSSWPHSKARSASLLLRDLSGFPESLSLPPPRRASTGRFPSIASASLALHPPLPDSSRRRSARPLRFAESPIAPASIRLAPASSRCRLWPGRSLHRTASAPPGLPGCRKYFSYRDSLWSAPVDRIPPEDLPCSRECRRAPVLLSPSSRLALPRAAAPAQRRNATLASFHSIAVSAKGS